MSCLVLYFMFLNFVCLTCGIPDVPQSHIFPGANFEVVKDVYAYESSIPLIYQIDFGYQHEFPSFSTNNITSCPWVTVKTCLKTNPNNTLLNNNQNRVIPLSRSTDPQDCTKSMNPHCETAEAVREIFVATQQLIERDYDGENKDGRGRRSLDFIGELFKSCCGTATQNDLHGLRYSAKYLADHTNSVLELVHTDHQDLVEMSQKVDAVVQKVQETLINSGKHLQDVAEKLQHSIRMEDRIFSYQLLNQYRTALYVYANAYQGHINSAKLDCSQRLLSKTLVNRTMLAEDLKRLALKTLHDGYDLAIPISNIDKYYHLPITSCTFYDTSLLLTVKIPLRKIQANYKIYMFSPAPLIWQDFLCRLAQNKFLIIKSTDGVVTIQEGKDCDLTTKLCMIPRYKTDRQVTEQCAVKILEGSSLNQMKDICHFHCQERTQEPVIEEISKSEYFVANLKPGTYLRCNGSNVTNVSDVKTGVRRLNIPCACQLQESDKILIRTKYPCDADIPEHPLIQHLIPFHWLNLSNFHYGLVETYAFPPADNLDSIINQNWSLNFPSLLIHNKISSSVFEPVKLEPEWFENVEPGLIQSICFYTWAGFVTLLQFYIIYKLKILSVQVTARKEVVTLHRIE